MFCNFVTMSVLLQPNKHWVFTMNFQMFKLVLEKAEEPEIKLPTSVVSLKKQQFSRKHLFLLYWLYQSLWLCGSPKLWKQMEIPDHLICLLRNLYARQEATVRTGHGTTDWFQIGKGVLQVCILSPCLKSENGVTLSCLTLCDAMDCSLPYSSICGIFQARVLE